MFDASPKKDSEPTEGVSEKSGAASAGEAPNIALRAPAYFIVTELRDRMGDLKIIRHPLDRFSFSGNMRDLDAAGRDSADQRLTMIGDMRFLKDSVWAPALATSCSSTFPGSPNFAFWRTSTARRCEHTFGAASANKRAK
jgi:hypothetical protein